MSSHLSYVQDVRGIGVFTAQPGMGKSFCLRCFTKSMNQNLAHMEYICLSTVGIREFYYPLCSVLGVEPCGSKPQMFRAVQAQVYYLYHVYAAGFLPIVYENSTILPKLIYSV